MQLRIALLLLCRRHGGCVRVCRAPLVRPRLTLPTAALTNLTSSHARCSMGVCIMPNGLVAAP
eukprot:3729987-Pleurochrysis_carterae.AAC.1